MIVQGPRRLLWWLEIASAILGVAALLSATEGGDLLPAAAALAGILACQRWMLGRRRQGPWPTIPELALHLALCAALFRLADPFSGPLLLTAATPWLLLTSARGSVASLAAAAVLPVLAAMPALLARPAWMPPLEGAAVAAALLGLASLVTVVGVLLAATRQGQRHARQLVEEQLRLRERRQRERAILEALDEPVLFLDEAHRVVGTNPRAEATLGLDLAGRPLVELLSTPEGHEPIPEAGAIQGTFIAVETYVRVGPSQGVRWSLEIRDLPEERDEASRLIAVLHRSERMFEQVRTGEDRHRALQLASTRRRSFLRLMSYELRTPLQAIGGFAELLALPEIGPLTDEQSARVGVIRRTAQHLGSILDHVREFVRLGERPPPVAVQFDLGDTVREAVQLVASTAERKGLALELERPDVAQIAVGDPGMTTQALLNLLTNAIRFTAPGGRVAVTVRRAQDRLEVEVEDSGQGIAWSEQARVFEPFDLGRAAAPGETSTGMGLAMARRLLERQGGTIALRSRPGHGSTFVIGLQRSPAGDTSASLESIETPLLENI